MMLRSSSTPVLGSLLQSHHESPNNQHLELISQHLSSSPSSFHLQSKQPVHHRCIYSSLNPISSSHGRSSPFSPSSYKAIGSSRQINVVRRAQSDGNLEGLLASCEANNDEFSSADTDDPLPQKMNRSSRPHFSSALQSIPSFSFHNSRRVFVDEDEYTDDDDEEFDEEDPYIGGGGGGGGGGDYKLTGHDEDGPHGDVEEHYRKMVEEDPRNPLFLRNYAQFLYQVKEDLKGAEEYYSRAILEDPTDGDILSSYAKVVWELHRDQDRAASYFERAVQASPEDSHVLAAHASFLWDMEEEEEEEGDRALIEKDFDRLSPFLSMATIKV